MNIKGLLFLLVLSGFLNVKALGSIELKDSVFTESVAPLDSTTTNKTVERKNVRVKAILFTILTGPLGGHRVYLRTRPGAPIIYALTLGGFGILPLVDLAHLIFKKDITSFEENPKVMMWTK